MKEKSMLYPMIVLCSMVATVSYAADLDTINKHLIYLVSENNLIDVEDKEHGNNYDAIKSYIEEHKDTINFNYASSVNGLEKSTALQAAIRHKHCGEKVVELLCQSGAKPVKGDGILAPGTICIDNILHSNVHNVHEVQANKRQYIKLALLKKYADGCLEVSTIVYGKMKLYLGYPYTVEDYKELLADTTLKDLTLVGL